MQLEVTFSISGFLDIAKRNSNFPFPTLWKKREKGYSTFNGLPIFDIPFSVFRFIKMS